MTTTTPFPADERGSIAIIFGFVLMILALFTGLAVDLSRAYGVSSFVSSALDSTALAVARELQTRDMSNQEVQQFAQTRFDALIAGNRKAESGITFDSIAVSVNRDEEVVEISAASVVPTYFAGLAGHDTMNVNESSRVDYNVRVVELSLMLDVTGSMSGLKINALKLAAKDLVEEIIPEQPRSKSNRVALAPYSASVNAGSYAEDVTASNANNIDTCVVARVGSAKLTDERPDAGAYLEVVSDGANATDIDPHQGDSAYACPETEVLPLSKSRSVLNERINSLSAAGYTAGHLGTAWAWYMISPEWKSVFKGNSKPARYDDEDVIKSVLLMTDGAYNTMFSGSQGDTSDQTARDLCDAMKAKGVIVYAVAFEAGELSEETLRYCATSNTHYFTADDTNELRTAFVNVAKELTSLRLTD
ncbi:MAG: pilus assembly protein [Pseudomonadota bacterium]